MKSIFQGGPEIRLEVPEWVLYALFVIIAIVALRLVFGVLQNFIDFAHAASLFLEAAAATALRVYVFFSNKNGGVPIQHKLEILQMEHLEVKKLVAGKIGNVDAVLKDIRLEQERIAVEQQRLTALSLALVAGAGGQVTMAIGGDAVGGAKTVAPLVEVKKIVGTIEGTIKETKE